MTRALLALEDGTWFEGRSLGARGETFGEVVFNTGMSGYQEVLTDPSYARQIVVMTAPQQGNYGVNRDDAESLAVQAAGFVVREAARRPSSWRSETSLGEYLASAGVVAIEDVDTRALTLHIRDAGAMRAAISTEDLDPASLARRAGDTAEMSGADLARTVSAREPYHASSLVGAPMPRDGRTFRVAALDWGLKLNSLRLLARSGADTVVFPATTRAEEILGGGFDGVFLSNGPGDPAATRYAIETTRALVGRLPLFGICLGHQILAHALGGRTYKLKFGHRGSNQPVLDAETGRVEITSHNHGFAVSPSSFARTLGAATAARGSLPLPQRDPEAWDGEGPAPRTLLRGSLPRPRAAPDGSTAPRGDGGDGPSAARGDGGDPRRHARGGEPVERSVDRSRVESGGDPVTPEAAHTVEPLLVETSVGKVALTHWNLNDGTLEGLRCLDVPAFSVQYHPEAAPGPHDAAYLFERFADFMEAS